MSRVKLTATQRTILTAAAASPNGLVGFYAGDRQGTRVVRLDELGTPWIAAYSNPEYFLRGRGFLTKQGVNELHVFRITDAGRAAIGQTLPDIGGPVR
ncbi:hypothetical protein [Bosea sp. (in: a-proteobacteria)]|jgi:hypothetical protein|uniref:hypothetical protein n=1 Tax=Bosea sp. (in: a-proteobacteria) TaxID=1871050 RepID=UPI00356A3710